jgi:hypothetical protein
VYQVPVGRWRPLTPQRVDYLLMPDDPVGVQRKKAQQAPLLERPEWHLLTAALHPQRSEYSDVE